MTTETDTSTETGNDSDVVDWAAERGSGGLLRAVTRRPAAIREAHDGGRG